MLVLTFIENDKALRKIEAEELLMKTVKKTLEPAKYEAFCFMVIEVLDDTTKGISLLHKMERTNYSKVCIKAFKEYLLTMIELEEEED